MSADSLPWSVPVSVDEVPETGVRYELTADPATRDAVARAVGLRTLPALDAIFELTRRGTGVVVKGEVRARVGQTCVVSLEPIENGVRETIDLVFVVPPSEPAAHDRKDEPPELLESGVVDLGAIAIEFLILGLDPYPRKPDAKFATASPEKEGESPFAALAELKKGQ